MLFYFQMSYGQKAQSGCFVCVFFYAERSLFTTSYHILENNFYRFRTEYYIYFSDIVFCDISGPSDVSGDHCNLFLILAIL